MGHSSSITWTGYRGYDGYMAYLLDHRLSLELLSLQHLLDRAGHFKSPLSIFLSQVWIFWDQKRAVSPLTLAVIFLGEEIFWFFQSTDLAFFKTFILTQVLCPMLAQYVLVQVCSWLPSRYRLTSFYERKPENGMWFVRPVCFATRRSLASSKPRYMCKSVCYGAHCSAPYSCASPHHTGREALATQSASHPALNYQHLPQSIHPSGNPCIKR